MFNVGPFELFVLAIVAVLVVGPDRLPALARDAAQLIRTLRDLATGARQQLRDELGPEFADVDLRNLNPRTAIQRAVLGEEFDFAKFDPRRYDPKEAARNALFGEDEVPADENPDGSSAAADEAVKPVTMSKTATSNGASSNGGSANGARPRPRPRPPAASTTPFDDDAT